MGSELWVWLLLTCCHGYRCVTDPVYEDVNNAFERSLVFLHRVR